MDLALAASHSRGPLWHPVITLAPSGLKATASTAPSCLRGGDRGSPVEAFQKRAVPSSLPVATFSPLGLKATASTRPSCPSALPIGFPVRPSHSLAVLSPWL